MKLFNKKNFSSFIRQPTDQFSISKGFTRYHTAPGFTLVELLIVIAILGILAASVLVAINPVKRINQAKDSTIKSDIGQIATAMQTYYTGKGAGGQSYYPDTVPALTTAGELKSTPVNGAVVGCTAASPAVAGGCSEVAVSAALNDPSVAGNVWCWRSVTGVAAETTVTLCAP